MVSARGWTGFWRSWKAAEAGVYGPNRAGVRDSRSLAVGGAVSATTCLWVGSEAPRPPWQRRPCEMASTWTRRLLRRSRGEPFCGDCLPTRVPLFGFGRPPCPSPICGTTGSRSRSSTRSSGTSSGKRVGKAQPLPRRPRTAARPGHPRTGDHPRGALRDRRPAGPVRPGHRPLRGHRARDRRGHAALRERPLWRRQKKLAAPSFSRTNLFQPEKFQDFEQTFRKTVASDWRGSARASRPPANGSADRPRARDRRRDARDAGEQLLRRHGPYEELRDRYIPSLVWLIDHMVRDTVGRRFAQRWSWAFAAAGWPREGRLRSPDRHRALRTRGRPGLWAQFKSEAPDEALRSNIRVFLAGALEATTSFASWAFSHLSRAPEIQEQIHEEVKDIDVYDPENLAQASTLHRVAGGDAAPDSVPLFPAAPGDRRHLGGDRRRPEDVHPGGTHVVLDVWHANRCEDFWGKRRPGLPRGSVRARTAGRSWPQGPLRQGHPPLRLRPRPAHLPGQVPGAPGSRRSSWAPS